MRRVRRGILWEAMGIAVLVALGLLWLVLPGAAWIASAIDTLAGYNPLAQVSWDHFVGFALATSLLTGAVHYLGRRAQLPDPDMDT